MKASLFGRQQVLHVTTGGRLEAEQSLSLMKITIPVYSKCLIVRKERYRTDAEMTMFEFGLIILLYFFAY